MSHEVVQLIPEFSNCVDSYDQNSNFDDCMYSKLFDLMVNKVGCTVPWLLNQSKICVDLEKRNQSFNLYQENRRNQENICPNSCKFSNMYFGPPVTSPIDEENKQNLGKCVISRKIYENSNFSAVCLQFQLRQSYTLEETLKLQMPTNSTQLTI